MKTLINRTKQETPVFFKKIRNVGIVVGSIGAAIFASPVALPVAIVTAAGYLITAGSVMVAVSQLTTPKEN